MSARTEKHLFFFGKIEPQWFIGLRGQFKFNHFIFDVVGIEFVELGVKVLSHLYGSTLVEDKIITGKHVSKNFGSKYLAKVVLDGGVSNSVGITLFEFHILLDLIDGDQFGGLVAINDESSRICKLWIRLAVSFCGTGVDDN